MQVSKIHTEDTPPELAPLKIELHRIVCEVGCLLKQIARHDQRYKSLQRVSVDALCMLTEPVRWGYECKTVRYYGKTYHFTDSQAEVIRVLKKRRELGLPRIHERSICSILHIDDELNSSKFRLISRFRTGKTYHPAIEEMIEVEDGWWRIL